MTASEILRRRLDDAEIEYGKLGDYTTLVPHDGISFAFNDCYDGMLSVEVARLSPDEAMTLVTERRGCAAKRYVYCVEGVWHAECAKCGRIVSSGSNYCSWCGIEFRGIERIVK